MYCPYCGSKIDDDARFCGECGASLEDLKEEKELEETELEDKIAEESDEIEEIEEEIVEEKPKRKPAVKKQYSKSEKKKLGIILVESIVLLCLVVVFVIVGSAYSNPNKIMKKYAQARQEGDWATIYELYDIGDYGFVSKDQFISFMQKKEQSSGTVLDYSIQPSSINNGVSQSMVMTYSTTGGSTGEQEYFTVKREGSNRFLFFQKWSLDGGNIFQDNLYIKYIPGITMKLDGVEIKKDYLTTYGTDKIQAYKIPVVLTGEHTLSLEDKNDFIEKTEQTVSVSGDNMYYVPAVKYTEAAAKKALSTAKTYVKDIYDAAYSKKGVTAVKKYFSNSEEAKKAYDEIVESYKYYNENGYSMRSYSVSVNSAEANTNAEEAGLRVIVYGTVKINYQYRSAFSGSIYPYSGDKSIYQSLVMGYDDGEWKIASFGY